MATNQIPLTVNIGTLVPMPAGATPQQFADEIADKLLVYLPSDNSTFVIGGSAPTSDQGPWFREDIDSNGNATYSLWVWSADAAAYVPLFLRSQQYRQWVGTTTPSQLDYDVWVKVDTDNKLLSILTYNSATNAWEDGFYNRPELDAFFEGNTAGGKKKVDWSSLVNVPANTTAPRTSNATGAALTPLYNYEILFHTGIGGNIIYVPEKGGWITVDGVTGDVREVKASTLGSTADFNLGLFSSALGSHPGWAQDTSSAGRVVVGADGSEVWNSTTTATKQPGSTFGNDEESLTIAQMPSHTHEANIFKNDTGGGSQQNTAYLANDSGASSATIITQSTGGGAVHNNVQKSIAYYRLVKL